MAENIQAPDMEIKRICQLEDLKILGFQRTKTNEWPEDELHQLTALSGSTLIFSVVTKSRFPIDALSLCAYAQDIQLTCSPVKSVLYPEEATFLPDVVLADEKVNVPGNTVMMFLVKADIPESFGVSCRDITLKALSDTHQPFVKTVPLNVLKPVKLTSEKVWDTKINFWYHWKALCDYYEIEVWSDEFWEMADRYLAEMKEGGHNTIFMTVMEDPFRYPMPKPYYHHHEKPCPIIWQHSGGQWSFDYRLYDRYVELNMKHGIDKEIECHSLLPCKRQLPVINYYDLDANEQKHFETTYDSSEYQKIWQTFLVDFWNHNKKKNWAHLLTLCPYDEPTDPDSFRATARMAKEVVPGIKICAAIRADVACDVSDVLDVASLHLQCGYDRAYRDSLKEKGIDVRWYNCCFPDWGNTLFSCGLADAYRVPWITFANDYKGYLRWAIFNVPRDVYENPGFNWPTGDMFLLYPGKDGPESSLRWEAMKAGYKDVMLVARGLVSPKMPDEKKGMLRDLITRMGKEETIKLPNDILVWRDEIYSCLADDFGNGIDKK